MTNVDAFFEALRRRWYVAAAVLVLAVAISPFVLRALGATYVGTSTVLLLNDDPSKAPLVTVDDLPALVTSPVVLRRVANRLHLAMSVDELRKLISAKPAIRSNLLPITFRDRSPARAVSVPNALAEETVRYYKELAAGQYDLATAQLRGQADAEEQRMEHMSALLGRAADGNPTLAASAPLDVLARRVDDLATQRAAAYATLVSDRAAADAARKQSSEVQRIAANETLASDPFVQAIRNGVSHDVAALALERSRYTSRYPGLPELESQVAAEDRIVRGAERDALRRGPSSPTFAQTVLDDRRATAAVAGDEARVAALDRALAAARRDVGSLATDGADIGTLRARLDATRLEYQSLRQRLATTKADRAVSASLASLVVIDRVDHAKPRLPATLLDVLFATAALIVAISAALFWDTLAGGLCSPDDLESAYGKPVVGTLGIR